MNTSHSLPLVQSCPNIGEGAVLTIDNMDLGVIHSCMIFDKEIESELRTTK